MNYKRGFSLIELAIVLVIAGLLLAGVMRGQELIGNARVKSLASDFRNIPTYLYGYQDRFRAFAGDDHVADTHLTDGVVASTNGHVENGVIQGSWDSTTATDESFLIWQHLRLAGLMNGTATITAGQYIPRNSEGGKLGVASVASLNLATMTGVHAVCSDRLLGKYAMQLDTMMDDGVWNTGAMRILDTTAQTELTGRPVDTNPYLVCMSF